MAAMLGDSAMFGASASRAVGCIRTVGGASPCHRLVR